MQIQTLGCIRHYLQTFTLFGILYKENVKHVLKRIKLTEGKINDESFPRICQGLWQEYS